MTLLLRVGDAIHLAAILILLGSIIKKRSVVGVSAATQILFLIAFVARYLDVFQDPLLSFHPILKVSKPLTLKLSLFTGRYSGLKSIFDE